MGDPPSLLEQDLDLVLTFLRKLNIRATFFLLGQTVEESPELVERIRMDNHEVACHGYTHNSIAELGRQAFENETKRARDIIRRTLGSSPLGYRSPNFRVNTEAINILEHLGFSYDSSLVPCLNIPGWYGHPKAPLSPFTPCRENMCEEDHRRRFWEIPVSVFPTTRLPGAGGWYVRNLGYWWTSALLKAQLKQGPATVYFHTWEIAGSAPRFRGVPSHVLRRTGRHVRDAITNLTKDYGHKVLPVADFLEGYVDF
jgi:peptidoglycan/xylan/chitin deacetylase (PgdA/CDA1 family)